MINILVLEYPILSNVAYWRLFGPLTLMGKLYPGVFNVRYARKELDYGDMLWADVVITARPGSGKKGEQQTINDFVKKWKSSARIAPRYFIVDIDDDILHLPDIHALSGDFQDKARRKATEDCLGMADLFWFSTEAFLETYHSGGLVVKNAILPGELPDKPSPDTGHWSWRGQSIQMHDLWRQGQEDWPGIRDKAKAWTFIGYYPPLDHGDNSRFLPALDDPEMYFAMLPKLQLNGVWKPMMPCQFNDHKSNIAWIEATMAGGACLTNYAGRPGWEHSTATFPTHKEGVALWEKSCQEIVENYNMISETRKRAESIFRMFPHLIQQNDATP
jgi:hypothetical protein